MIEYNLKRVFTEIKLIVNAEKIKYKTSVPYTLHILSITMLGTYHMILYKKTNCGEDDLYK